MQHKIIHLRKYVFILSKRYCAHTFVAQKLKINVWFLRALQLYSQLSP